MTTVTTSRYIARLIGPVLLIMGIGMAAGMLIEGDAYSGMMKEFIGSRALIFLTGALALTAGVAIVNAHNVWERDWRVLVTILGWLAIIRGVVNLVFPATAQGLGDRMVASHAGVVAGAAITIVLGAILCIVGYEHLWAEKRKPSPARASGARTAKRTPRRRR